MMSLLELLTKPQTRRNTTKHQASGLDNTFIEILLTHQEIWRDVSLSSPERGLAICCPLSSSFGRELIPKDYLLSHILLPGKGFNILIISFSC